MKTNNNIPNSDLTKITIYVILCTEKTLYFDQIGHTVLELPLIQKFPASIARVTVKIPVKINFFKNFGWLLKVLSQQLDPCSLVCSNN